MYQPVYTDHFKKRLKKMRKKYPQLKRSIIALVDNFVKNQSISLGGNTYKLRFSTPDIQKGKNKSFRLVILLLEIENLIVPLTVYFKGDTDDISPQEIELHVEAVLSELKHGV